MTCTDAACNLDREQKMTTIARDGQGVATIWCDPCIADIVAALNAAGLRTIASCCGHNRSLGRITLADGREIVLPSPDDMLTIWSAAGGDINRDEVARPLHSATTPSTTRCDTAPASAATPTTATPTEGE